MKMIGLIFLLFFFSLPVKAEANETLEVYLDTDYGRLHLEWTEVDDATYAVTLQGVDTNGEYIDLSSCPSDYNAFYGEDMVAYYCQENGFPEKMRFHISATREEEVTAEGFSEEFNPKDFFPERESLQLKEDIPLEAITAFSWHTTGSYVEANQNLYFHKDGNDCYLEGLFYRDSKKTEVKKKLKEQDWQEFLALLSQGEVVRDYIMDPEIEILDGGDNSMELEWEGMSDMEEKYYVYSSSNREAIINWLETKGQSGRGGILAIGGAIGAGLLAGFFAMKKKRK
ncbi:MAG: hypothetical protein IKR11_07010 [Solobacterium sp.]|nr:hypothetical protein [Solobacterium sp.]